MYLVSFSYKNAMHFFSPPCHNSRHNTSYNLHVTHLVMSR